MLRIACVAVLLAFVAACATQPRQVSQAASWEARRAQLQQRERFDLRGRVAVAAGQEGFNARMRWIQEGSHSQLWLDGPLGVGGAQVSLDEGALSVRNSKGEALSDAAARAELETRLGFDPPLRSLRYWIQGVPDPARQAEETLDDQQRLAALVQDGWHISYSGYRASGDAWLPERLTLQREAVRVRVLVESWSP